MSQAILFSEALEVLTCGSCSIPFAIPEDRLRKLKQQGGWFWCPNGHQIHYTETDNDRLLRKLEATQRERDRQREIRERTERQLSAQKGVTTRMKNRIAKGVCPCCHRHFVNVERHMANKHPSFEREET